MSKRPVHIEIRPKKNETFERTLKRFKKKLRKIELMEQLREYSFYEKPSIKKRKKKIERKRMLKRLNEARKDS